MIQRSWLRVSKSAPCPICKKADWCTVTNDGALVCCMRIQSDRKSRNGGYIHATGSAGELRPALPPPQDRRLLLDCAAYHAALRRRWDWIECDGLSVLLGVNPYALERLQPAFDAFHGAWAFPMRDGDGKVCGIRLREIGSNKWTVRGSREGLFFDPNLQPSEDLFVCEGPTDTAAAMSLGISAVGRPSCNSGVAAMAALIRRLGVRRLTIIADQDAPHRRPDGTRWYPGREGAEAMAKTLRRMWRMVLPPEKDFRAWYHTGLSLDVFNAAVNAQTWRLG